MNCAEKLLEPTVFFNLYTKSNVINEEKMTRSNQKGHRSTRRNKRKHKGS